MNENYTLLTRSISSIYTNSALKNQTQAIPNHLSVRHLSNLLDISNAVNHGPLWILLEGFE